jgi:acetyltransferase-like isoleucine patch superfamily enzyme
MNSTFMFAFYIGNDEWIEAIVTICKGLSVGHCSIIGSNSFVNKNVPAYCIVGGVPARIIESRNNLILR